MEHFRSLENVHLHNAWLTIGTFDGVHLGHQEIIEQLTAGAHQEGAPAVVLTFDPHPVAVLRPEKAPPCLSTPDERARIFEQLGVDVVITYPFNREVAALSAKDFITQLKTHLGFTQFWVGYDFALGRNREGDIPALRQLGNEFDFQLHVIEPVDIAGKRVSSSQIRALLADGQVQEASELLGRPYHIAGTVVEGAKRGRTIGIPTANLDVEERRALPGQGVYVCRAHVNGIPWGAVTNIGVRPTFENGPVRPSVEAHLLDFSQDIYDQVVQLEFLTRLREERKFSGIEALVQQIKQDIADARGLFAQKES